MVYTRIYFLALVFGRGKPRLSGLSVDQTAGRKEAALQEWSLRWAGLAGAARLIGPGCEQRSYMYIQCAYIACTSIYRYVLLYTKHQVRL